MKKTLLFFSAVLLSLASNSQECNRSSSSGELDINNIRAMYLNGGDMFWDQPGSGDARYEIPKGSGKHSLYAGTLWLGGYDSVNDNLLVTAQTYRHSHYSYWPGPVETPNTNPDECSFWNKHFEVKSGQIGNFVAKYNNGINKFFFRYKCKHFRMAS